MDFRAWKYEAVQLVRRYADLYDGGVFTARDVRGFAYRHRFQAAADDRHWGQVMQEAQDLKVIRRVGAARDPWRRGGITTLWRSAL